MNNRNLKDALLIVDMMIKNKGNVGWAYNMQLSADEKMSLYEKALEVGSKHLELIRAGKFEKEQYR